MKPKRYDGYQAYDYLGDPEEMAPFDLAPELDRLPAFDNGLTTEQQARADRLIDDNIVVSLHDHPVRFPADMSQVRAYNRTTRQRLGYEGLSRSGMDAVFDNLMNGFACVTSTMGWKWNDAVLDLGMRLCDLAQQDFVILATTVADIERAHRDGLVALVMGLEASTPIENEVDRLDVLYGLGIRQMGIAYSEANCLGSGLREDRDAGLTDFGQTCVRRMNHLGMAVDISHSGDETSLDTIRLSTDPVLITHAGARGVWPTRRMKSDEVIVECARRGGVIGLEAAPHTTLSADHPQHSIESVMDHFTYCVDLVGIEHVAFGPDTIYGDHVALHDQFAKQMSVHKIRSGPDFEEVSHVEGLENPTECFPNIVAWLVKHGYSDDEIGAVIGGNVMRALTEIWGS